MKGVYVEHAIKNSASWDSPQWLTAIENWAHSELNRRGIEPDGAIEQIHLRPWSTIVQIPTRQGNFFFKATMAGSCEAALTQFLVGVSRNQIPLLISADLERGWMILGDGGLRLREALKEKPQIERWEELLPEYARLQIAAYEHIGELIQQGIPDRSISHFPELYRTLVADREFFLVDHENGITSAEYQRLLKVQDWVAHQCERLATYRIPMTLHHGDLHDANIFINSDGYCFADWGDCSVSHPFFSLRTSYVSAEVRLGLEEGSPELNRLRDAYLQPWQHYEPMDRLLEAFTLAVPLWSISSALIWHNVLKNSGSAARQQYDYAIPALAQEFLSLITE